MPEQQAEYRLSGHHLEQFILHSRIGNNFNSLESELIGYDEDTAGRYTAEAITGIVALFRRISAEDTARVHFVLGRDDTCEICSRKDDCFYSDKSAPQSLIDADRECLKEYGLEAGDSLPVDCIKIISASSACP